MVKRFRNSTVQNGEELTTYPVVEDPHGSFVMYSDYQSLQAALREALDGWEEWLGAKEDADRVEYLRKQFLDM